MAEIFKLPDCRQGLAHGALVHFGKGLTGGRGEYFCSSGNEGNLLVQFALEIGPCQQT